MTEEEIVDCVMEIDSFLSGAEDALQSNDLKLALARIREARAAIEDLREDDECNMDNEEVGIDVMRIIK